jgi:hypothetical protein
LPLGHIATSTYSQPNSLTQVYSHFHQQRAAGLHVRHRSGSGLVDFSRHARDLVARFKEIRQKHGVFPSIETLDAFRYGKINKPLVPAGR